MSAAEAATAAGEAAQGEEAAVGAAVDVLLELLETAFHQILFLREIYPPRLFEKRKRYGIPVQVARHPDISQYLSDALEATRDWCLRGAVHSIALIVLAKSGAPLERFVFDVGGGSAEDWSATLPEHTERYLRAVIMKISTADAVLRPLPPDCTFAIHVTAKEEATQGSELQDMPYILAAPEEAEMDPSGAGAAADGAPTLHPLKRVDVGPLCLHVYAEEAVALKAAGVE